MNWNQNLKLILEKSRVLNQYGTISRISTEANTQISALTEVRWYSRAANFPFISHLPILNRNSVDSLTQSYVPPHFNWFILVSSYTGTHTGIYPCRLFTILPVGLLFLQFKVEGVQWGSLHQVACCLFFFLKLSFTFFPFV